MDLAWADATELADLVRRREVRPRELADWTLERIDALDGPINSVVTRFDDLALTWSDGVHDIGQPFFGVPFLVKESAPLAGVRATGASAFLVDRGVVERDGELMRRYRAAGLIPVGKTNMPEFGILGTTEPALFGPTRNPWDLGRTAGGSSGGAAAAVAAGLVPVAHGGDSGGSIRIPASCCGVVGLKPSRGRNPRPAGSDPGGLSAEHVLTRSMRDCAAVLDATAGPFEGSWCPPPMGTFGEAVTRRTAPMRIAFSDRSPLGFEVSEDCRAAVRDAAALCEALGHIVEEDEPAFGGAALFDAFDAIWMSELAAWILGVAEGGALDRGSVEPLTWAIVEVGRTRTAADYQRGVVGAQVAAARAAAFHERRDVWITPTLSRPPVELGWFAQPEDDPLLAYRRDAEFCAFTPVANMTGQPAMSIPLSWNDEGLPIGVQLTAAYGDEETLLDLGGQLEEARPWAERRPPAVESGAPAAS
jgi:amidase